MLKSSVVQKKACYKTTLIIIISYYLNLHKAAIRRDVLHSYFRAGWDKHAPVSPVHLTHTKTLGLWSNEKKKILHLKPQKHRIKLEKIELQGISKVQTVLKRLANCQTLITNDEHVWVYDTSGFDLFRNCHFIKLSELGSINTCKITSAQAIQEKHRLYRLCNVTCIEYTTVATIIRQ